MKKPKPQEPDADLQLILQDPKTGPTVKALMQLPAFKAERKKHADRIRKRAVQELLESQPSIQCPRCGKRSYHPMDITERFCGACDKFHDEMQG